MNEMFCIEHVNAEEINYVQKWHGFAMNYSVLVLTIVNLKFCDSSPCFWVGAYWVTLMSLMRFCFVSGVD